MNFVIYNDVPYYHVQMFLGVVTISVQWSPYTALQCGQYHYTHIHSHFTQAVAATNSCSKEF